MAWISKLGENPTQIDAGEQGAATAEKERIPAFWAFDALNYLICCHPRLNQAELVSPTLPAPAPLPAEVLPRAWVPVVPVTLQRTPTSLKNNASFTMNTLKPPIWITTTLLLPPPISIPRARKPVLNINPNGFPTMLLMGNFSLK